MQAGNGGAARPRSGAPIWSQAAERFPPADRVLSTILTRQAARYRDRTLFAFGLLNASFLAACIVPLATAYAVAEAFGWEAGVNTSFRDAPLFTRLL